MKRLIFLLVIVLFAVNTANCQSINVSDILDGEHSVYNLPLAGAYNYEYKSAMVGFYWQNANGDLIYSELPIGSVEFNTIEGQENPTVEFKYKRSSRDSDIKYLMDYSVTKAIISISSEDFEVFLKSLEEVMKLPIIPA